MFEKSKTYISLHPMFTNKKEFLKNLLKSSDCMHVLINCVHIFKHSNTSVNIFVVKTLSM